VKLKYVDALRGLAIVAVVMVHCSIHGSNEHLPAALRAVVWSGTHGVQLFYVVSAFTMFLTLDKGEGTRKPLWSDFFIRRFFRIAPMYYVGICYFLWQDGLGPRYWLGDADHITTANILSNVLFVHGLNPYWITSLVPGGWSIAVEVLFYCLLPVLFTVIRNTRQAFWFTAFALALRMVLQFVFREWLPISSERLWYEYLYFYLPSQLPVFALGILCYFIVRDNHRFSVTPLATLTTALILTGEIIGRSIGLSLVTNHFLFGIAFAVLLVTLSRQPFWLLVNPVFVYIGKISYSMYLVHFAVLYWLTKLGFVDYIVVSGPLWAIINYALRLLVVMALAVPVASLFYVLVERPIQAVGKELIARKSPRRTTGHERPTPVSQTPLNPLDPLYDDTGMG
jgi:peptidoglycan/LPS O-acetylase OafA/YrhL